MSLKPVEITSSEDPIFDDIRPCRDNEVQAELHKICSDQELLQGIINFRYPLLSKFCPFLLKPLVRRFLEQRCANINTIADFQKRVADFMHHMIMATTDGVRYDGFDALDKNKGYLFISNHRDISLDPAFIDLALYENHLDTVRIAIGDNLLKSPAATSLMRLNKSFIVKRSVTSPREKLRELTKLSRYIGLSIAENHSVWIAQREGRAKDGNDRTEEAVLKMIYMAGRAQGQSFAEYMKTLNIVPVSISYEYDPSDLAKARELEERAKNNGEYKKGALEDLMSIVGGIKGYKGCIRVVAGQPLTGDYETAEDLAAAIDGFIWNHYEMFPSALIAAGADHNKDIKAEIAPEDRKKFLNRLKSYPVHLRERVQAMYAYPYKNLQEWKALQAAAADKAGTRKDARVQDAGSATK